jgi:predicted Zn-dependent protease
MFYSGYAFHKEFEGGRKSGTLSVRHDKIVFTVGDQEYSLPLARLEMKLSGAGNRLLYFSHPDVPDCTFYTPEKRLLKDPCLKDNPVCLPVLQKINRRKWKLRIITGSTLLILLFLILAPFLFIDPLIRIAADQVPIEWEQELGDVLFETLTADKTMIDSEEVKEQLEKLTGPLVKVFEQAESSHRFDFYVVEDPTLNAFALPGGKVVIHSGLLLTAQSPEEVAGVLAHEMAHVTCRHHIRGILKRAGIVIVVQLVLGDVSALTDILLEYGSSLAVLKNSRKFEFEADKQGWNYLHQATIDPEGMITFFQRLQDEHGSDSQWEETLDFLSTHPATGERIRRLEKVKKQLPAPKKYYQFELDFPGFQDRIRKIITSKPSES